LAHYGYQKKGDKKEGWEKEGSAQKAGEEIGIHKARPEKDDRESSQRGGSP